MTDKKVKDIPVLEAHKPKELEKPLVIKIDWWLGRVIAMSWAITELAKKKPVHVITSRPLVFWWNEHVASCCISTWTRW